MKIKNTPQKFTMVLAFFMMALQIINMHTASANEAAEAVVPIGMGT